MTSPSERMPLSADSGPLRVLAASWIREVPLPTEQRHRNVIMGVLGLMAGVMGLAIVVACLLRREPIDIVYGSVALLICGLSAHWTVRSARALRYAPRPDANGNTFMLPTEVLHVDENGVKAFLSSGRPPREFAALGTTVSVGPVVEDAFSPWPSTLRSPLTELQRFANGARPPEGIANRTEALYFTREGRKPLIINGFLLEESPEAVMERIERVWRRPHERVQGRAPAKVMPDGSPIADSPPASPATVSAPSLRAAGSLPSSPAAGSAPSSPRP